MIPFSRNLDICSLTFLLSWAEKLIVVGMVDCIGVKRKSILYSLTAFKMLGSCGNGFHFPSKCWIWLISWSTLWFSLARPNLLVGCPVHVTLGGLAASGTGAFVVVPGWTFPEGQSVLCCSDEIGVLFSFFPIAHPCCFPWKGENHHWKELNCHTNLYQM